MKILSVVIVSYNTKQLLEASLHSLESQVVADQNEIIVVDNNSTDGSASMVRDKFPSIKLISLEKNYGYGHGVNRGYEIATGEYVLVSNSDINFPPGSIARMVEKIMARSDVAVLCPEFTDVDGSLKQLSWQWRASIFGEFLNKLFCPKFIARYKLVRILLPYLQRKEAVVASISGAAFLIRRNILKQLDGFDEHFQLYYEDSDFFERLRSAGYKILFSPEIKVIHGLGKSWENASLKIKLIFTQSHLYYYKKHLSYLYLQLLKLFLKVKFRFSSDYRQNKSYRYWADYILNQRGIIPLWQDLDI